MDRRRLLPGLAGLGIVLAIGTPGLAGDDLCKSPRLGVTPTWCGSKEPEAQIPEGHVSSHESAMLGIKKPEPTNRPPRAFRAPKSVRPHGEHRTSRR